MSWVSFWLYSTVIRKPSLLALGLVLHKLVLFPVTFSTDSYLARNMPTISRSNRIGIQLYLLGISVPIWHTMFIYCSTGIYQSVYYEAILLPISSRILCWFLYTSIFYHCSLIPITIPVSIWLYRVNSVFIFYLLWEGYSSTLQLHFWGIPPIYH